MTSIHDPHGIAIPWVKLNAAVMAAVGPHVYDTTTRSYRGMSCGRALVRVYGLPFDGVLHFREEGKGHPIGQTPDEVFIDTSLPNWFDILTDQMVSVLKTGRTIEVGKGIGRENWSFYVPDNGVSEPWEALNARIQGEDGDRRAWDLNPDYQRKAVWTRQQQERFIGHVLSGGAQPLIYVQRYGSERPLEVIDGQQRLRAICAFVQGDCGAQVFHDGVFHTYLWKDMNEVELRSMVLSSKVVYVDLSREDRLRFYHRVNSGVAHTPEELDRVQKMITDEFGSGE